MSVKGLSLGSGAVLFVGLAVGAMTPRLVLPPMLGNLGLLLFLYGVGIAYGAQFFRGLSTPEGVKANLAALAAVGTALAFAVAAAAMVPSIGLPQALGAFAGAGTSTAALQAASAVFGTAPATGYSVAYPVGVAVPVLLLGLYNTLFKPTLAPAAASSLHLEEIDVTEFQVLGMSLAEATVRLPDGVSIVAIRRGEHNLMADDAMRLARGDVLLVAGNDPQVLHAVAARYGPMHPGAIVHDRSDLDYERFFVSSPAMAGLALGALQLPPELKARVLHLRRSDADLALTPARLLEPHDSIGVLAPRSSFPALRKLFGDSVRSTGEVSYIGIGVGVTLGLGFGAVAWPLPFAATIANDGVLYLLLGSAIASAPVVVTMLVALLAFRLPFDSVVGIVAGTTGNRAILAFANRIAPTDRPDIGYAMIFPSMTVLKIVLVQVAGMWGK